MYSGCGLEHHTFLQAYGKDDSIGCYLDLDSGVVGFSKNGGSHC